METTFSIDKLVGHKAFQRGNPMTDRFKVKRFHHVEFLCLDATTTSIRFGVGLGLQRVAKSDLSTGNSAFTSYAMRSGDMVFVFTAPNTAKPPEASPEATQHPLAAAFDADAAVAFCVKHGMAVRAVAVEVEDAQAAYETCVAGGGTGVTAPRKAVDPASGTTQVVAEVLLYQGGDVVLRLVSGGFGGPCLVGYEDVTDDQRADIGLLRIDHVVGNVPKLLEQVNYVAAMTGFHEFAEFTAEDVGTVDSGLNSIVLACDSEAVLLPINEPTHGTKRRSQIQTYLDHNNGPGVQHIALLATDAIAAVRALRARGAFDLMPRPSDAYYEELPGRIGGVLSEEQYRGVRELGLLVDRDDQGTLIQVFTKPLGDRPTIFLEIIQRVGCDRDANGCPVPQRPGCGGFGKGNFRELFKSIEDYERQLERP
eukprot:TRINITY_DN3984_c0_g1_i1.p1 TRINITY_DN3984_c0_g1~~TRINITY_DN3984_c0_g1_i1.p1  ORF type:complete len:424 (-),score=129.86 TRINITY_DN3984_c0_g1_i1:154-1425(-)